MGIKWPAFFLSFFPAFQPEITPFTLLCACSSFFHIRFPLNSSFSVLQSGPKAGFVQRIPGWLHSGRPDPARGFHAAVFPGFIRGSLTCVFFPSMFLGGSKTHFVSLPSVPGLLFHKWEQRYFCIIIFQRKIPPQK